VLFRSDCEIYEESVNSVVRLGVDNSICSEVSGPVVPVLIVVDDSALQPFSEIGSLVVSCNDSSDFHVVVSLRVTGVIVFVVVDILFQVVVETSV